MSMPKIAKAMEHIDEDLLNGAMETKRIRKKKDWIKWTAAAACLCLAVAGVWMLHADQRPDKKATAENGGIRREYAAGIRTDEMAILWPWEERTLAEQFTSVVINGKTYDARDTICRSVDKKKLGKCLGTYEVSGVDPIKNETHQTRAKVYAIGRISTDYLVAVQLGERFYPFFHNDWPNFPTTLGAALDAFDLSEVLSLCNFDVMEGCQNKGHYRIADDAAVWKELNGCRNAARVAETEWHPEGKEMIAFWITSDELNVYDRVLYVSRDGYLCTNIFDYQCVFRINEEAAEKVIGYAHENGREAEPEPSMKEIAGTVTAITEEYLFVDDTVLCKNKEYGMVFKLPLEDLRVSRCVKNGYIRVGDLVAVSFTGVLDGDIVRDVYMIAPGTLYEGSVAVYD